MLFCFIVKFESLFQIARGFLKGLLELETVKQFGIYKTGLSELETVDNSVFIVNTVDW